MSFLYIMGVAVLYPISVVFMFYRIVYNLGVHFYDEKKAWKVMAYIGLPLYTLVILVIVTYLTSSSFELSTFFWVLLWTVVISSLVFKLLSNNFGPKTYYKHEITGRLTRHRWTDVGITQINGGYYEDESENSFNTGINYGVNPVNGNPTINDIDTITGHSSGS